jgi:hypothetical protein
MKRKSGTRSWLRVGLRLQVVAAIGLFCVGISAPSKAADCAMLEGVSFRFVFSDEKLQSIISQVIKRNNITNPQLMNELSRCYVRLGNKFNSEIIEYDVDNRRFISYRFDLDQTDWVWPSFFAVPGGSNGRYYAVFRYYHDDNNLYLFVPRGTGILVKI